MSQAIPLVPSIRKDVKADLAPCRIGSGHTKKVRLGRAKEGWEWGSTVKRAEYNTSTA